MREHNNDTQLVTGRQLNILYFMVAYMLGMTDWLQLATYSLREHDYPHSSEGSLLPTLHINDLCMEATFFIEANINYCRTISTGCSCCYKMQLLQPYLPEIFLIQYSIKCWNFNTACHLEFILVKLIHQLHDWIVWNGGKERRVCVDKVNHLVVSLSLFPQFVWRIPRSL